MKIVIQQLHQIMLQHKYKNNPLAMPPLTPEEREEQDKDWQEAIRRGLHHRIHREVERILFIIVEPWEIQVESEKH